MLITVVDQLGALWRVEIRASGLWAHGVTGRGARCVRQVWDGEVITDLAEVNAVRRLVMPDQC